MRSRVTFVGMMMLIIVAACSDGKRELTIAEKKEYAVLGDSISAAAQDELLRNVASAIQRGGVDHAVTFCNAKAMELSDSLSISYQAKIERLSDRNRNPANAIQTSADSAAWKALKSGERNFVARGDDRSVFYYKPILLGMPTCLKCHGGKPDIDESTGRLISQMYPEDRATGYRMGELRGMWKIEFEQ